MAFHGFDLRVKRRQVQSLDQLPNQSRRVVMGNQIVNPFRVGIDLRAVGRLHPGSVAAFSVLASCRSMAVRLG